MNFVVCHDLCRGTLVGPRMPDGLMFGRAFHLLYTPYSSLDLREVGHTAGVCIWIVLLRNDEMDA